MSPKHQSGYSNIRAISCIAICILHTFFAAVSIFQPEKGLYAASYAVRNAMYFAVPCFVMVTGALLLDPAREIGFSKLFGRYIRRILLALVIFTLLFALFDAVTKGETVGPAALKDWLFALFFDKSWAHMWYLYMLLGLYLLLPFYRKAAAASDTPAESKAAENTEGTEQTPGVDPELKAFLDSYEKFIDEYVAFMKTYNSDPANALSMLAEYSQMMASYADFTEKLAQYDENEMSAADAAYYLEVTTRCTQKMLEILSDS